MAHTHKNRRAGVVARAAVAAALSATMTFGGIAPTVAWADGEPTITVTAVSGNEGVTYKAYKLFSATSVDTNGKAQGISWPDDATKTAVLGILKDTDASSEYSQWATTKGYTDKTNPTVAAEYIAEKINGSTGEGNPKLVNSGQFADSFAQAILNTGLTYTSVTAGAATNASIGYWLLVTNSSTDTKAGTAPVWLPVGASGASVTEKTSVPTFSKTVGSTNDNSVAVGDILTYTLTATIPSNYAAYETYSLKFEDHVPTGLTLCTADGTEIGKANSVSGPVVKAGDTDITASATIKYEDETNKSGKLTIGISNTKDVTSITKDTKVTATYYAKVNKGAEPGNNGVGTLQNSSTMTYSNDPNTNTTHTTSPDLNTKPTDPNTPGGKVNVYTYGVLVDLKDDSTGQSLDGEKFHVKDGDNYLGKDGSVVSTLPTDPDQLANYTWEAGTDGKVLIKGLDSDKEYELELDKDGYNGSIKVTINPTMTDGALTGLSATASDTGDVAVDGTPTADTATGLISITAKAKHEITLPLTGMTVSQLGTVVGSGLVVGGIAVAFARRRRKASE